MDYTKRRKEILKLRSQGKSFSQIAGKFNISKQRVSVVIKNGSWRNFGREFIREKVRMRDKHTCQECGKKWVKGQRRFDTHHLNGLCGKKSMTYDRLENINCLITLCHKCHLGLDEVRHKMSEESSPRPNKKFKK